MSSRIGFWSWLERLATVGLLLALVFFVWKQLPRAGANPRQLSLPKSTLSLAGTSTKGRPDAPVGILMFSDFQCPFCQRFARETLPELERRYIATGEVSLTFRHLPLPIHPLAGQAAAAAECAAARGKFWAMHDALFRLPTALDRDHVIANAREVGIEAGGFQECLDGDGRRQVDDDAALAARLGVSGTPTFLIGSVLNADLTASAILTGARPLSEFANAISVVQAKLRK